MNRGKLGPPRRAASGSAVRPSLLVFAEGRATERQYLTDWYKRYRHRVTVQIDPFHGAPLQLVEHAVSAKQRETREEKKGRGRAHSQIWCIFDRDEHPHLPRAFDLAKEYGIHTAFSNPCLELWFLWHFQDHAGHLDRYAAQHASRRHLGCDKNLSSSALDELANVDRFTKARARAFALDLKHAGDGSLPASNPSSGVWRLIDEIRGA